MFSKPLFKQSCKANFLTWILVTFATCFMLAVVIVVIGLSGASYIKDSMVEVFQDDAVYAEVDKNAMTYYYITETSLKTYDQAKENFDLLIDTVTEPGYKILTNSYQKLIDEGKTDDEARNKLADQYSILGLTREYVDVIIDYYLVCGDDLSDEKVSEYLMNRVADGVYEELIEKYDKETADFARTVMTDAISKYFEETELSREEFASEYIAVMLGKQLPDVLAKEGLVYTASEIEDEARTAIKDFRGRLLIEPDAEIDKLIDDLSISIFNKFPEDVRKALEEIQDLDIFGLIVGTVFFKMAGLLLPIVYTITVANNLIAGQVDSGSMAYVLSTPTKRTTVIFTQMCYLITSLFVMFALSSVTGIISLAALGARSAVTISIPEMLLLNAGAFITMCAISGICFLASAWFNRSKQSMTWGGGLSMFFLVTVILGLFGSPFIPAAIRIDSMNFFNYVTIISLFDSVSIMNGTLTYLWKFAILLGVSIVCYIISVIRFKKKDLPL